MTRAEWLLGAFLQLLAGILWAYIIGGLVGVVTAMQVKQELFRQRIDEANNLISVFMQGRRNSHARNEEENSDDEDEKKKVAKRIRRFVYNQHDSNLSIYRYVSNLETAFPVMESLSPDLKRSACLMLAQKYLNQVPYLSSRFLSSEEQSHVAKECIVCEFPREEVFRLDQGICGHGRGVLVLMTGAVWRSSKLTGIMSIISGGVVGDGHVLLEDGRLILDTNVTFISFGQCLFIPRTAILAALDRNSAAWTDCARWKYFATCLVEKAIIFHEKNK